jgi:DNA repair photolyase
MESGNPVQMMSRFNPGAEILGGLAGAQTRPGQVLYSTSITTATHWRLFERYSAVPAERMQALRIAKLLGMSTNVMVKPFIPGVTGSPAEVSAISALIRRAGPDTVVVGDYAFDSRIATIIRALIQKAELSPPQARVRAAIRLIAPVQACWRSARPNSR